ncbi:LamG-like jellyroll fold domain-containing protein [Roseibacillus persicicus]|uniref:LamG-like jellyroll fold domain-containing protein n=1 Tax=Roseibacillus persicicus TaxID=454148 RepID=UPI00280F4DD0|nr:LamG-like jellyroll fold domain-containing protein [Roseibacillus persicicus]MDQ8189683.1 FecR domain-containing protein [Roseibacillus persicicus]
MKKDELIQLIDDALDGDCSEADFLRLEAQLHVDVEARKLYYSRLLLQDSLTIHSQELAENSPTEEPTNIVSPDWGNRSGMWLWAGAFAAAASITLGFIIEDSKKKNLPATASQSIGEEPVATGFGVLAESSGAVWDNLTLERGALIPAGPLKLESGLAKLELFSGVQIIIEGEAEFELHSAMEMTMQSGKLQAQVPEPAHGFKVQTASGEVVDLGTQFAMNVTAEHNDLQVLEGEIEWHPKTAPKENLLDGDSLRWTVQGQRSQFPANINLFEKATDFEENLELRKRSWQEASKELQQDSRLLAYFTIEPAQRGNRHLSDRSAKGNDGTIVRASRATNRWGESERALDFSPTGSRVRLNVPGKHPALTLYCWLRIDSLDRHYNSLFLTDGHELHEPHWQIMHDGRLFFSVKAHNPPNKHGDKHIAYSPPIWTPAQSGQWMQVATVYDSANRTTTHYVNGKQVSQDKLSASMIVPEVSIGAASIGNWSEPYSQDPDFAVRNLNGAIDEFALFSTALSAEEINTLYQTGKP